MIKGGDFNLVPVVNVSSFALCVGDAIGGFQQATCRGMMGVGGSPTVRAYQPKNVYEVRTYSIV
jgi:hypothetical protein